MTTTCPSHIRTIASIFALKQQGYFISPHDWPHRFAWDKPPPGTSVAGHIRVDDDEYRIETYLILTESNRAIMRYEEVTTLIPCWLWNAEQASWDRQATDGLSRCTISWADVDRGMTWMAAYENDAFHSVRALERPPELPDWLGGERVVTMDDPNGYFRFDGLIF